MLRSVVLLALTGCELVFPLRDQDRPVVDGPLPPDGGPVDTQPLGPCHGSDLVQICPTTPPDGLFSANGLVELDTDTSIDCATYGVPAGTINPGACLIARTRIEISGTLRATGSRPLILLAIDEIAIPAGGVIDVSSALDGNIGAGFDAVNFAGCSLGSASAMGGGAGGSFGTLGGKGGNSNGGTPAAAELVVTLRGGCRGGNGTPNNGVGSLFGLGGGAVALIAPQLDLEGRIDASGSAGRGNKQMFNAGGGGGGSGGMILLDGQITGTLGEVMANGGGGGEGAGGAQHGADGTQSAAPDAPGVGGTGGGGGDGGNGGGLLQAGAGKNAVSTGGGGGGGGAGVIRIAPKNQAFMVLVSPLPSN